MSRVSLMQFVGDKGPNGEALTWPGTLDGFPVMGGRGLNLKQEEYENMPISLFWKGQKFELWKEEDLLAFGRVQQKIASGLCVEKKRFDHFNEEHQHHWVWLEWLEVYGTPEPPHMKPLRGYE